MTTKDWMAHLELEEQRLTKLKAEVDAYVAAWPCYCKHCGGTGMVEYKDWVDYGSTQVSMATEESCPKCIDQDKCPRCGEKIVVIYQHEGYPFPEYCASCGWKTGAPSLPEYD